jgi:hypothetical protein
MSQAFQLGAFLEAMYTDRRLKHRIIISTFLALVLPAAFLMTMGVPEKPLLIGLVGLLLPVQLVVFAFSRREAQTKEGSPGVPQFWKTAKGSHVIVWTSHPTTPAGIRWDELLERVNSQNPHNVAVVSRGRTTTDTRTYTTSYKVRMSSAQIQILEELIRAAPAEPKAVVEQQRKESLLVQQVAPPQVGNLLASAWGV